MKKIDNLAARPFLGGGIFFLPARPAYFSERMAVTYSPR